MNLFRRPTRTPTSPQTYPSGTAIQTEKGFFYIKGKKRYRILSQRVLDSWRFVRIAPSTEAAVSGYQVALTKLGFRDGTLIHNIADGKIYLVAENKKRHITSPDVLDRLGAKSSEVITVSVTEINLHDEGEPII